jgi:hypothetical protein
VGLVSGLVVWLASGLARAGMPPEYASPSGVGYRPVTEVSEPLSESGLRASVKGGTLRAMRGYTPLEVVLQNTSGVPRPVRLSFRGHSGSGSRTTSRSVEVGPGQVLSTFLLVPPQTPAGSLRLESPGIESFPVSIYMEGANRQAVLVLGTTAEFEAATAVPRADKESPRFSARFLSAKEAPRELAAYVGYDAVVLVEDMTTLPADVWAVLEAYAATGGYLVLPRPSRDARQRLPLLPPVSAGELFSYGFGRVRLCGGSAQACGTVLGADLLSSKQAVQPAGRPPRWERNNQALANGQQPLLPNAQAPLGRFLALIFLFTLVVGPGGLALARRKGPVALLIAVPAVAFVTCAAIILNSVLVDGFGVHASRFGYTWLDRERDRAVTVGLSAWYANLPPGRVQLPAMSALVSPEEGQEQGVDLDWTNGLTVGSGFLPSRTYREWGEVAVVPSRARLVARREGDAVRVQNALGAPMDGGVLWLGGRAHRLPQLADGAEGAAAEMEWAQGSSGLGSFLTLPHDAERRFGFDKEGLTEALAEGDFIATVGGGGFGPTATALEMELHEGTHLVRGRVDGP